MQPAAVLRSLLALAGVVGTMAVAASLVLRQVDVTSERLVAYVAATPVVVAVGFGAVVLLLISGSRARTAVAGVLTTVLALTQVPLYLGAEVPAEGAATMTVMTVNLHYGDADADEILAAVREHGVDVLATQELTNPAVETLRGEGIDGLMPFQALNPGGSQGNGLWSRHPLTELDRPGGFDNEPVAAAVDLDGRPVFVACVHPESPYPDGAQQWSAEMHRLAEWLEDVDGPAIVAGDFNSTADHRQFRGVLEAGFEDAATQVGAGWLPTFPANRRRVPLLITIDHVLANRGIVATSVERVVIAGTDHAALVVRLAVPPGV